MKEIGEKLAGMDWSKILRELHGNGFVIVPEVLAAESCAQLIEAYDADERYRKTISMERYRFGSGEYKYFQYPLPDIIEGLREKVYSFLVPVANQWMKEAGLENRFPTKHEEMKSLCHNQGQMKPTALILKYGAGGFNTLHQDLYGPVFFPIQIVLPLNQIDEDYTGGEFIITEQIPRAQSKANVLRPKVGDMLIFTTNFRPVKGSRGYYKVNMKHGVSTVHSGKRYSMGIIFHDALT